ncbi:LacI family DNA-binding transcriptional regulator [Clostridium manihotivorum]|uniref:LacI family transcriptional regulator n=1 Tax=Clostridium manihotivorum TaxID=2320868 RepID=A0A410E1A3_9CLOT|nr:LacI family DNA-binding transcriptional regulator [Clostridium manihotivorum]QAA35120.1 LacI family transcriptional regulator [Clostridium manihotivorum]
MGTTISDIAKKSGVSLATVSRVLNNSGYVKDETRNKVLETIKEMNYTPSAIARSLSKNETNTIGVIVPDITNSYFGELIKGISEVAEASDLNIVLFNTDDNLEKELKALTVIKEHRLKGVIMSPMFGENEFNSNYVNTLENLDIPIIFVVADVKYTSFSGVFVDNIKGGFDATNLLIKEGHKKIGIITGLLSSEPAMDRLMGYKKALAMSNIPIREEYIFKGDFKLSTGYDITKGVLSMDDGPTALVVCSNMMTMGAVKAIFDENKKIPDDLAIVGFDKLEFLDMVGIKITYMEDCPEELGKSSMNMLKEVIENRDVTEKKRVTISPTIIIKGSEKKL